MRRLGLVFLTIVLLSCGFCPAQATRPAATQSAEEAKLNEKALVALDRVLPALTFDAVGFGDVAEFMQDVNGIKIVVPWDKLKALGIDKNTAVSMKLRDVKFGDGLSVLLASAAGKPGVLSYTIEHGEIVIVPISSNAATRPK